MNVIDPQTWRDAEDGRALRELVAAMKNTLPVTVEYSAESGNYRVKAPHAWYARPTIAEAADACREALR